MTGPNVSVMAAELGLKFSKAWGRGFRNLAKPNMERADGMAALYRDGDTLEEIGKQYGLTRERVRQILSKHKRMNANDGGQHVRVERQRVKREAARDAKSFSRWGCSFADFRHLVEIGEQMRATGKGYYQTPVGAYRCQENNAKIRGIGWEITLWEWWSAWQQSGKWEQRGRGRGYVMCRNGDVGPYALGNIHIATGVENSSEGQRKRRIDPSLPIGVSRTPAGAYAVSRNKIYLGTYPTVSLARTAYLSNCPISGSMRSKRQNYGLPSGISASNRSAKFRAYFYVGKKQRHVGLFATVEEAVTARAAALQDA